MAIRLPYVVAGWVSGMDKRHRSLCQHDAIDKSARHRNADRSALSTPRTIRWNSMPITMSRPRSPSRRRRATTTISCSPRRITIASIRRRDFSAATQCTRRPVSNAHYPRWTRIVRRRTAGSYSIGSTDGTITSAIRSLVAATGSSRRMFRRSTPGN